MSLSVFNSLCETWRRMSAMGRIVAIGAVSVSVLYGGGKGERGTRNVVLSAPHTQSISTNVDMSSPRAKNWNVRGAWEDVFTLKFGNDFRFPYGSNLYNAVKVFSQGYIIPFTNPYSSCILADIGPRVSIVPGLSNFYYEYTQSNSYRFVWNNVPLGRHSITNPEPPQLNNFSLELLRSGDVLSSSNGVVRTIPRTFPFDWDRDGIINERDNEPLVYNGDNFGNENILPYEANSNNYCWVDIVVSNSISRVTFQGDGESNYPDPDFVALPNCMYRVYLLIGKTYEVLCNEPVVVSNKSSSEISVTSIDNKPLKIVWPVTYEIESVSRSASRRVRMKPAFISGRFNWSTNTCCTNESPNSASLPMCEDTCECQGCLQFGFTFSYEGYKLAFEGIECGCKEKRDGETTQNGAFLNLSFSHSALFYEESYTNSPGDVVARRISTNLTITCTAEGGEYGGVLNLTRFGFDKLLFVSGDQIPEGSITLTPNEMRVWKGVYAPLEHSDEKDDVVVAATFTECLTGIVLSEEEKLTCIQIILTPINTINGFIHRHKWGICEKVLLEWEPSLNELMFNISYDGEVDPYTRGDNFIYVNCPTKPLKNVLRVNFNGVYYNVLSQVFAPQNIIARNVCEVKYDLSYGLPGGAGMHMDLYVIPEDVSFQWLSFMEVPSTHSDIGGYFTNTLFSSVWYHTEEYGAGEWFDVKPENFIVTDYATMGDELIIPWYSGYLYWNIPIRGKRKSDNLIVVDNTIQYQQKFEMSNDGCLRVSKFGFWVERESNGERNRSIGVKKWDE